MSSASGDPNLDRRNAPDYAARVTMAKELTRAMRMCEVTMTTKRREIMQSALHQRFSMADIIEAAVHVSALSMLRLWISELGVLDVDVKEPD